MEAAEKLHPIDGACMHIVNYLSNYVDMAPYTDKVAAITGEAEPDLALQKLKALLKETEDQFSSDDQNDIKIQIGKRLWFYGLIAADNINLGSDAIPAAET